MAELSSKTGSLEAQGAPLYYEVAGQGHPLLLLHAGIADSSMWDEQFPVFAQQYRTIRYDLRGYGRSRFPSRQFADYEDPVALFQFLGIQQAHVIGISFGGKIALDFALAHPEMVTALVLVAPGVGGMQPSERLLRFGEEEDEFLSRGDLEGATELNLRMWVDGPRRSPDQVNPQVRQRVHDMQYHAFTIPAPSSVEEIALQPPAISRLAEIRVPTLIIVGDHDLPEMIERSAELAAAIPGAQHVVIPGVAHMVSMEQPEQFNRLVLEFLHDK